MKCEWCEDSEMVPTPHAEACPKCIGMTYEELLEREKHRRTFSEAFDWATEEVRQEALSAIIKKNLFHSTHEAYGVLAEEVAELLDALRSNDLLQFAQEAKQIAAIGLVIVAQWADTETGTEASDEVLKMRDRVVRAAE